MCAVFVAALWLHANAGPRAIALEFPHEIALTSNNKDKPVSLSARWVKGSEAQQNGPALTAWVSFGRIDKWRQEGDVWVGEWLPPDPAFPGDLQLVISTLQGERIVYTAQTVSVSAAIDLPGKSEPDAQVEILLGGETFGPVHAGSDGRFKVSILVPPNVSTAVARSKDKLGNVFKKTVDLYVPKVSTTALACPATRTRAGAAPLPVQRVNGTHKRVDFVSPQKLAQASDFIDRVEHAVDGAICVFEILPLEPADVRVVFEPPYLAAQTRLVAYVLDRFGNRTKAQTVTVREGARSLGDARLVGQRYELPLSAVTGVEQRTLTVEVAGLPAREVTLEQVPDRGVRLTAKREGAAVIVNVSPPTEPVTATDARGAAVPLHTVSPGVLRADVGGAEKFVLVTHASSGTSVLVRLP